MEHSLTVRFARICRLSVPLWAALMLVPLGRAPLFAEEDKPAVASDFAAEIASAVTAFKARDELFSKELKTAGRDMEKVSQANTDYNRDVNVIVKTFIKSLEAHRSDAVFLDGLVALVVDLQYPPPNELLEIVKREHIGSDKLARMCPDLGQRGDEQWSRELLEAICAQSPHRDARGKATYALGEYYRHASLPFARTRPQADIDKSLDKAREFYNLAINQFADVQGDNARTIGQQAALQIVRLDNFKNLAVGKPAPEITGKDLDGRPMSLSETRGKVTVIVFWGSWCGPCMRMVPHEKELLARHTDKPFGIIGVNSGDD